MTRLRTVASLIAGTLTLAVAACQPPPATLPPAEPANPAAAAAASTDAWVGRWQGPEGTYLDVAGGRGTYAITIKDLDRARTFPATASGDRITFQRDGVAETLRHTDGAGTGMKWLADASDCLTVKPGEGFCRRADRR